MFTARDQHWLEHALMLAKKAEASHEVPVGAVLILNDEIIGEGFNQPIQTNDPTAHAEIIALREGARNLNNYRLVDTTLYVTLEPCLMCVGALIHARVKRVVFGAFDPRAGAVISAFQMQEDKKLNHRIIYQGGLLKEECGKLLSEFFQKCRTK